MPEIDREKIVIQTRNNQVAASAYIKNAELLQRDADREKRIAINECAFCFYTVTRIPGDLKPGKCGICREIIYGVRTPQDAICAICATKHDLCRHCGGCLDSPASDF